MRKFLDNNHQVAHYFANSVQDCGHGSNFYFETDRDGIARLFSYGRHFCIARRLNLDTYAVTTRKYGQATSKHLSYARGALCHRTLVYCNDPSDSASCNKAAALDAMNTEMRNAETTRRIRQSTRDSHKAAALYLAERFNAYLAALPESERADVEPFDVSGLDEMRAALAANVAREEAAAAKQKAKRAAEEREYLAAWRTDTSMYSQGMSNLPVALRLNNKVSHHSVFPGPTAIIQTSHGAEIPVEHAVALWPVVVSVKTGERSNDEAVRLVRRLGVYSLSTIRKDGSIVVGCHDIAFCELERMAVALELLKQYRVTVRGTHSGRSEVLTMNTWPAMDVEQEAARLAASYGAQVEAVAPVLVADEVAA